MASPLGWTRRDTRSDELPSIVWMLPSGRTDSTMPMCSSQTMRSPGFGFWPEEVGIARPLFCAHAYSASTEPKPSPWSPTGTPALRASQETKYAHHGPGPGAPAVALRYCAMRGELFDPGGCSAWPTSACAIATMRAAAELPLGAVAGAAVVVAGAAVGPTSRVLSWAMRERADSRLIFSLDRTLGAVL